MCLQMKLLLNRLCVFFMGMFLFFAARLTFSHHKRLISGITRTAALCGGEFHLTLLRQSGKAFYDRELGPRQENDKGRKLRE